VRRRALALGAVAHTKIQDAEVNDVTRHTLTRGTLDCVTSVGLTEAEYAGILSAKRRLIILVRIEKTFDPLFSNYAECESTLLGLSLSNLLRARLDYSASSRLGIVEMSATVTFIILPSGV
jgi:hypothetical protein